MAPDEQLRFVIIGGGPAGHSAATGAATLGAHVTLIEDSIVGGAAHLWDCIPSKAMVASSMRLSAIRGADRLGLSDAGQVDLDMVRLSAHLERITESLALGITEMLDSQGVEIVRGRGRFTGANEITAETADGPRRMGFDDALVSTGSRPWVPAWAPVDGRRVITTAMPTTSTSCRNTSS